MIGTIEFIVWMIVGAVLVRVGYNQGYKHGSITTERQLLNLRDRSQWKRITNAREFLMTKAGGRNEDTST